MDTFAINPSTVPEATGGYVNALDVHGARRTRPALTVILAAIRDPAWLIEIEAVAAA